MFEVTELEDCGGEYLVINYPDGPFTLSLDDAYSLMTNIRRELTKLEYESPDLRNFKEDFDKILDDISDEELEEYFGHDSIPDDIGYVKGDGYIIGNP